ncbi:hypothetical protein SYNTR_2099 [Candidatus Syntrophocurvum alkaliphilum]|uniref:Uncharacterized protein n=1 Tax=Candidatus Syntrophocurvum alkaliphilum TaxID=2293317 RepID=A0A6I6DHZ1_9FIRM|nr:hypothetical protein SYNTR_2099 [Candidatus Syntrophocurvum alkaliphilum]
MTCITWQVYGETRRRKWEQIKIFELFCLFAFRVIILKIKSK